MLKSIFVGLAVAFSLPLGWLLLWRLGIVTLKLTYAEDKAIGFGFVAGMMAERLIWGLILGFITAFLLYVLHFRKA